MNVAFIPVRGGSKSIPLKNIKKIMGKPLVYWVITAAVNCDKIDKIYVSTDCQQIKDVVSSFDFDKVEVIERSKESATDTATTESAMLEFCNNYQFDNIVLIQATSPLLKSHDLDEGFKKFEKYGVDSVLSVTRQKRFIWAVDKNGYAKSVNYNYQSRPRRQDFDGYLVENGAFYITSKQNLLESKNRLSGNIAVVEMEEDTYFEIDEPSDWKIIENIMKDKLSVDKKVPTINMLVTDCDGCLTDGGMYYSEKGDELKKFNTKDGMGIKLLKSHGVKVGIITGEDMKLNERRAKKMKLDFIKGGIENKLEILKQICKEYSIDLENVAYIGDDINDLEVIQSVGFGCCVNNAVDELKDHAKYISKLSGGEGAVREIIDYILKEQYE